MCMSVLVYMIFYERYLLFLEKRHISKNGYTETHLRVCWKIKLCHQKMNLFLAQNLIFQQDLFSKMNLRSDVKSMFSS